VISPKLNKSRLGYDVHGLSLYQIGIFICLSLSVRLPRLIIKVYF